MADLPPSAPPPSPTAPAPAPHRRSLLPSSIGGWLMLAAGLACIGYGGYTLVQQIVGGYAVGVVSVVVMAIGGMIVPYRWVGLAAGVALVGLAVYLLVDKYSMLNVLLVGVLGLIGIAERVRRGRA